MTKKAAKEAIVAAKRYPDKSSSEIQKIFNYQNLIQEFGRVEDFEEKGDDIRNWTFWTYANLAKEVFGDLGKPISSQLRNLKKVVTQKVNEALDYAVSRRSQ